MTRYTIILTYDGKAPIKGTLQKFLGRESAEDYFAQSQPVYAGIGMHLVMIHNVPGDLVEDFICRTGSVGTFYEDLCQGIDVDPYEASIIEMPIEPRFYCFRCGKGLNELGLLYVCPECKAEYLPSMDLDGNQEMTHIAAKERKKEATHAT